MGNFDDCCILFWDGGRKTVPFSTTTNVPSFFTAPSLRTYQTFAATFEACEAPYFQRETVLQVPGCTLLRENAEITPEEFVAEENFHCGNRKQLINTRSTKMTRPFAHPMYLTHLTRWPPLMSPFAVGTSFLIHPHQLLRMKMPPLLPLMTKLN